MPRWEYAELRASREFAIEWTGPDGDARPLATHDSRRVHPAAYLSEVGSAGWEVIAVTEEGTRIYTLRRQVR
ncbi:MAG TPA: hypothetical protein VJT31_33730 [Rugosimonospora sp.]|nr:hypothetical protein [Rugosimonospora sp.]